jgi:hypothetical protein
MALVLKDRVKETSTTAGTGTITLAGAVAGFQSFSAVGNGNTTYYAIVDNTTGDWEVGIGTYTASGTTLSRTTVLSSSNSGSLVNFVANPKDVFVTYPSEKSVYEDASNVVNATSFGAITATSAALTTGTVSTTPASNTDIANKSYVDGLVTQGISYHEPVFVESPNTVGNLNATYNNGASGVGATLTNAGTQVALTIDGVLMTVGKRVLIYNQTNQAENGVYTVTTVGTGSTNWVLTRATDADTYGVRTPSALGYNDAFFVTNGDTGAGETYVCTTTAVIVFGTTAITFAQISSAQVYNAGTGLTLSPATTFNIANTGVTANTYGSASAVPVITVNAQGQATGVTNTTIAINGSQVSGNISGSAGSVANALTLGTYLTGGTYNGSAAVTATVDATSANTASKVVARDSSGNFSAGTITATLSGSATSATAATNLAGGAANQLAYQTGSGTTSFATAPSSSSTYLYWNGSAFAWGAITSGTVTSITAGAYLTGGTITTSGTIAVDATDANTASKVVARDASGNFSASTITAALTGNATSATNSTTVGGLTPSASAGMANRVVAADANGYIFNNYFNSTDNSQNSGVSAVMVKAGDNYIRSGTASAVATFISGQSMNIAGNATTTSQTNFSNLTIGGSQVLYAGNYNSYAPTLTGTGASGTWSINVTGSAGSAGSVDFANLTNKTSGTGTYTTSGDYRAPIFYDSDNTGYYLDPASTSELNKVYYNSNMVSRNYGIGQVGLYDSTKYQAVFSMGEAYILPANGTTTGNLYGIAWSHPNAGGAAANLASHGILMLENGGFQGAWGGGSLRTPSDVRGTIFYDYSNTAYYVDPAGGSYLYSLSLSGSVYFQPNTWIQQNGSYGMYWPNTNGAHLEGNTLSSYGAIAIRGSRGSYGGMFDYYSGVNFAMYDSSGNGGIYREANGRWYQYYLLSNDCTGFGTSTTNAAYNIYCPKGIYSGGRVDGTIFYDSNNTGYYLDMNGSSNVSTTVTGNMYFLSNFNTASGSSAPLQTYSNNGSGAVMSFHRGGAYAVNMGLDSDNVFRLGGWSAPANLLQIDMSGNLTMLASVTAYSDERLKKDWADLPEDFVERLARVKSGTYTRIDNEMRQIGVGAQSLQPLMEEAVFENADGTLSVAYGNAAMVSSVELAKYVTALEQRISQLEARI